MEDISAIDFFAFEIFYAFEGYGYQDLTQVVCRRCATKKKENWQFLIKGVEGRRYGRHCSFSGLWMPWSYSSTNLLLWRIRVIFFFFLFLSFFPVEVGWVLNFTKESGYLSIDALNRLLYVHTCFYHVNFFATFH